MDTFRGMRVEWEYRFGECIGFVEDIRFPFYFREGWYFSLNDKLIEEAIKKNATLRGKVGDKEYSIRPSKNIFKRKKKDGLLEEIPTKFEGMSNWYRVLFKI